MSKSSNKHMEAARVLAMDLYHNAVDSDDGSQSMDMGVAAPLIASALCNAQREGFREGMKRAAEIARKRIVGGHMHGVPEWPDGDDIADAILSETGKVE